MFGKLKEKLKNWTKKISEESEEIEGAEEGDRRGAIGNVGDAKKDEESAKSEKKGGKKGVMSEKEISKEDDEDLGRLRKIAKEKEGKKEVKKEEPVEKGDEEDVVEKKEAYRKNDGDIKIPTKFNDGTKSLEPDFDKLKGIRKDLEKVEEIKEEIKKGKNEFEPKEKPGTRSFFEKVTSKIKKVKISEKEFDVYAEDLEMLLLENNVALEVAEKIISELKDRIIGKEFLKREVESEVRDFFREIIEEILLPPYDFAEKVKEGESPYVILFCGVNGTGKTTTIAKVADYLKGKGIVSVLAAGDTFRAASIEQLKTHGERLGVKVISHTYGSDPASVGFDAIAYAKKNKIDCVLIDTAGRMHTAKNLLKEMEKIVKVCTPDLKIFVGESITGNDILEQVRSFDWAIGIDGIVLSKADIDEKGGTALSVGYVTKKPILYLGTGQEYDKFETFDKQKFVEKLGL